MKAMHAEIEELDMMQRIFACWNFINMIMHPWKC